MNNYLLIAAGIIILLIVIIVYASITHSIEKNRQQKSRTLKVLKQRLKNFSFVLEGFPEGFLSPELRLLVCRCIIDVLEQLSTIQPQEADHVQRLKHFTSLADQTKQRAHKESRVTLENPQQIKEVRGYLVDLNKFIESLEARNNINRDQARGYKLQIKKLILQVAVDTYIAAAKRGHAKGKLRVAIHYYTMANQLLKKDGGASFAEQISNTESIIAELEPLAEQEQKTKEIQASEGLNGEWDKVDEEDQFSRKNVYD